MKPPAFLMMLPIALSALASAEQKPNVLFIISDDLTAKALSCYENKTSKTPNIDRLASQGTRYTRTYCQFPVCGPSRASFMSGYYPHATGTMGYTSGRENIGDRATWSQHFINHGYHAARVSKIFHMGVPGDIETGSNGADDEASWSERHNSMGPEWKAPGDGELLENNPDGTKPVKGGKPFFLAVGFVRPHVPFVTELIDLYPTVADLCGLEVPARLQGKSLAKTLDDPAVSVRDAAFCVNSDSCLLRTDQWAFIQHGQSGGKGLQLYDLTKDPKQYTNLADHPEYREVVDGFKKQLAAKLGEVGKNDLGDIEKPKGPGKIKSK